ncbi:MAG: thiolase family protein [Clostridia bacterium]|nr:thiolase family protein [Clostridia bacterium]
MKKVYIAAGLRTPIGKRNGSLKNCLPEKLAASLLNGMIRKCGLIPSDIDQVILGNAAGPGGNIARVALLEAGWPYHIPGVTIDYQCGSALSAVNLAASLIASDQADLVVAGGVESTSLAPRRQFHPNDPRFCGEDVFYERAPFSPSEIGDPDMIEGAENLALLKGITREEMDSLALSSHQKACRSITEQVFKDIILPVESSGKIIDADESIRPGLNHKLLERMPALVKKDGLITAGNACLKHDGAAVVLLASEAAVEKYGLSSEAAILDFSLTGVDPNLFPLGPAPSIKKLIQKNELSLDQIDIFEINEAFAVKILACALELGLSLEKMNVLGGALAFGHPYGASGAIILIHLIKALEKVGGRLGIASIGVAGGQGISVLIERSG